MTDGVLFGCCGVCGNCFRFCDDWLDRFDEYVLKRAVIKVGGNFGYLVDHLQAVDHFSEDRILAVKVETGILIMRCRTVILTKPS